jgi:hypothetical protein
MVDETEPRPGARKNGARIERTAIGWDPYEVWRTRIQPHQYLIEAPAADKAGAVARTLLPPTLSTLARHPTQVNGPLDDHSSRQKQ